MLIELVNLKLRNIHIYFVQIDPVAAQAGLTIAGYYIAHENFNETSLEKANHRISDKIAENFGAACIVVVSYYHK